MKKATVRVAFNRSLQDGLSYPGWYLNVPGLACFNDKKYKCWWIVHEKTGLLMGWYRTRKECAEFAEELAQAGWDVDQVNDMHQKVYVETRAKYLESLCS